MGWEKFPLGGPGTSAGGEGLEKDEYAAVSSVLSWD